MVTIVTGTTNKPTASEAIKQFFQTHLEMDGYLYIGYPIIGTVDGAYPIDALLISPEKGIVAFNLIEGKNTSGYEEAQDDCANKIEAKLKGYKQLVNKRTLCVDIYVITFAPGLARCPEHDDDYPLCVNAYELESNLSQCTWADNSYYSKVVSVLQAISSIRKGKKKRDINCKEI